MSSQQQKITQSHIIMPIKSPKKKDLKSLPISFQVEYNKYIEIQRNIRFFLTKSVAYSKYFFESFLHKVVE